MKRIVEKVEFCQDTASKFLYHHVRRDYSGKEIDRILNYDIVCRCGNNKFTLSYGYYCIKAKCTDCGMEEEVYDG